MNKKSIFKVIILMYVIIFSINSIEAVQLDVKDSISVDEIITVTLDFGENVSAYDSLEVTFNSNTMEYVSGDSLKEGLWWDTTQESEGIRTKTYTFKGKKDGISTIKITAKGVVSANATMDSLGDIEIKKTITIGKGYTKGDLNSDGIVNSADAAKALTLYKYNNATEDELKVGDMNGDGLINSADAARILSVYKYNY